MTQVHSARLLGITLDDNQKWTSQLSGKGGVIPSLNSRLFIIKRLSNYICKERLKRVADSLYMSKLRYGVQLCGKVRLSEDEPKNLLLSSLQITQNKFARFLNGTKMADRVHTSQVFSDVNILSVNQMNAQIKLIEV